MMAGLEESTSRTNFRFPKVQSQESSSEAPWDPSIEGLASLIAGINQMAIQIHEINSDYREAVMTLLQQELIVLSLRNSEAEGKIPEATSKPLQAQELALLDLERDLSIGFRFVYWAFQAS